MNSGRGRGKPGQEFPPPDGEPTAAAAGPILAILALACAGVAVYEWVMVLHG